MRKISVSTFAFLISLFVNAQFKLIAEGPVFEEPEAGIYKLLQLKNNNTCLFSRSNRKDEFNIIIYDADHKQKLTKLIEPSNKKLRKGDFKAIFSIENDVVLMINYEEEKIPILYRLVIDGSTGALKEERKILELNKSKSNKRYENIFKGNPSHNFFIKPTPENKGYALVLLDGFEPIKNKQIGVVFYNQDHKEINRVYYSSDNGYTYFDYIDMTFINDESISILVLAHNNPSPDKDSESELLLLNADIKKEKITSYQLDFSKGYFMQSGLIRYNPVSNKIILIAISQKIRDKLFLTQLDPFTGKSDKVTSLYTSEANKKRIELFGTGTTYSGRPQDLCINNDGSFSIIYEQVVTYSDLAVRQRSIAYHYEDIIISIFDKEGKIINNYLIPKRHVKDYFDDMPFSHTVLEDAGFYLFFGRHFKNYTYLNSPSGKYILLNDIEENDKNITEKGEVRTILGIGGSDAFYFNISGTNVLPSRQFVFGKSEDKNHHNIGSFAIFDYNKETNVLITLKLEMEERKRGVKFVWLQPQ